MKLVRYTIPYCIHKCAVILVLLSLSIIVLGKTPEVRFFGYVLDSDNRGIELANVFVEGTTTGTTTNQNGYYGALYNCTKLSNYSTAQAVSSNWTNNQNYIGY